MRIFILLYLERFAIKFTIYNYIYIIIKKTFAGKSTERSEDFSSRFVLTEDTEEEGRQFLNEDHYHRIFIRVRQARSFSRSVKFRDNECLSRHRNVTCHISVRPHVFEKFSTGKREQKPMSRFPPHRTEPSNMYRVANVALEIQMRAWQNLRLFASSKIRVSKGIWLPWGEFSKTTLAEYFLYRKTV